MGASAMQTDLVEKTMRTPQGLWKAVHRPHVSLKIDTSGWMLDGTFPDKGRVKDPRRKLNVKLKMSLGSGALIQTIFNQSAEKPPHLYI
jgi:hypothetical protein